MSDYRITEDGKLVNTGDYAYPLPVFAKKIGMDPETLRRWARQGRVANVVRIGKHWWIFTEMSR